MQSNDVAIASRTSFSVLVLVLVLVSSSETSPNTYCDNSKMCSSLILSYKYYVILTP